MLLEQGKWPWIFSLLQIITAMVNGPGISLCNLDKKMPHHLPSAISQKTVSPLYFLCLQIRFASIHSVELKLSTIFPSRMTTISCICFLFCLWGSSSVNVKPDS